MTKKFVIRITPTIRSRVSRAASVQELDLRPEGRSDPALKQPHDSEWLTADEAATYLGLPSRRALYQRVRRGQVPVHGFGRSLRFHKSELDGVLFGR